MKVFVATSDTQSFGGSSVMDCIEGELVWVALRGRSPTGLQAAAVLPQAV